MPGLKFIAAMVPEIYSTGQRQGKQFRRNSRGLTLEHPRMWAILSAGDPRWHKRAVGCGRLTPACTRTSDCTRRFLGNSRELIGLLLLLACIFESLLPSTVGIASIVGLAKSLARTRSLKSPYLWLLCKYWSIFWASSASRSTFDCIFVGFLSILSINSTIPPSGNSTTPIN